MSINVIGLVKEMLFFYFLGIFEGDYFRVNVFVLLVCYIIVFCDFNWNYSFLYFRRS